MSDNIFKVWGERRRIFINEYTEMDLLYLIANSFCSLHYHKDKINHFTLISGAVAIETEFGMTMLHPNESWIVYPPMKHRFHILEDSVMIEVAFTKSPTTIDPNDIIRIKQGGRTVHDEEFTEDELREKGLLDL